MGDLTGGAFHRIVWNLQTLPCSPTGVEAAFMSLASVEERSWDYTLTPNVGIVEHRRLALLDNQYGVKWSTPGVHGA